MGSGQSEVTAHFTAWEKWCWACGKEGFGAVEFGVSLESEKLRDADNLL